MKKVLWFPLSLATLSLFAVASCKNSDSTVTPADRIAGEYKLTLTATYTIEGKVITQPGSGTLSVYKGNTPGSYYFVERYPGLETGYLTTHNNGSFTLDKAADVVRYENIEWYGYQSGSGTTDVNKITFTKATDANTGIIKQPNGSDSYVTKAITKRVSYVATK